MLLAVAVFAAMDACLKLLSEHYPVLQVAFFRGAAALPFILLPTLARGRLARLRPTNFRLHLVRGALAIAMLASFVLAVRESSLASTYSIFMCAPLLVAALSAPVLGEKVAGAQWGAIAVGLAGVLLMLKPGAGQWAGVGALWAAVALVMYTLSVLTLRILARSDSNESMVFWFTAMLALGAGVLALPSWRPPQFEHLGWLAGVGLCGALGQYLITVAFRAAPAAVVSPFEYTALIWGVTLDVFVWGVWPDAITWLGGTIVIGAGLYVVVREGRAATGAPLVPDRPPPP